jgi:hypothetical protein
MLVDSNGLTWRLLIHNKFEGPPTISFSDLAKYMCRVFELEESTEVHIKYNRGGEGDKVVVEEELEWEETCFSLSNHEVLSVDIEIKLPVIPDTKRVLWQQITVTESPHHVQTTISRDELY